jgi:hypothetical protein
MQLWTVFVDAIRRVNRAPALVAAIWLFAILLTWPIAMSSRIDTSLTLDVSGMPLDFFGRWMYELRQQTVERSVEFGAGIGQVIAEPGAFIDYESRWLVALTQSYPFLAFLTLVSGGFIDRLARDRRTGPYGVCGAAGLFFLTFLRLGVVIAVTYAVAFRVLGRSPVALSAALAAANLIFDYVQVFTVIENRRSAIGAFRSALRFLSRNGAAALLLYLADWIVLALIVGLYVLLGPGTGFRFGPDAPIGWTIALWIAINQMYVVARLWARLLFWSSAVSLVQQRAATHGYVARSLREWPDATTGDAVGRL